MEIMSQKELSDIIGKTKQYISLLAARKDCPFAIIDSSGQTKVIKNIRTLNFIRKYKPDFNW